MAIPGCPMWNGFPSLPGVFMHQVYPELTAPPTLESTALLFRDGGECQAKTGGETLEDASGDDQPAS